MGAAFAQHLTPRPMGDIVLHREESVGHSPSFARHSPDSASGALGSSPAMYSPQRKDVIVPFGVDNHPPLA